MACAQLYTDSHNIAQTEDLPSFLSSPPNFKFFQALPAVILAVDWTGNSPMEHSAMKVA
jgi:hypothetical protein